MFTKYFTCEGSQDNEASQNNKSAREKLGA